MLRRTQLLKCLSMVFVAAAAQAQVPFPPQALLQATSIESAAAALGTARPEFSTYLLLDVPEIAIEGSVSAVVKSEIPGTSKLVLIRQFPAAPKAVTPANRRLSAAQAGKQASVASPRALPTIFIAASQIEPGRPAEMLAKFDFSRNEQFTLFAFAQGRWFATAREIKLAHEPSDRP